MKNTSLELRNVSVQFRLREKNSKKNEKGAFNALEQISFSLKEGDRLGVFGKNGSGKTTLLRTLSGFYTPQQGIVEVQGKMLSLLDIGAGMQSELTGLQNLELRLKLLGFRKERRNEIKDNVIEFAELGEFINQPFRLYSSGMKMRIAFGITTSLDPEILVMDEWLSVGDKSFKEKASNRMDQLHSRAGIVVMASHSRSLIERTCNKFMKLEGGKSEGVSEDPKDLDEYF